MSQYEERYTTGHMALLKIAHAKVMSQQKKHRIIYLDTLIMVNLPMLLVLYNSILPGTWPGHRRLNRHQDFIVKRMARHTEELKTRRIKLRMNFLVVSRAV